MGGGGCCRLILVHKIVGHVIIQIGEGQEEQVNVKDSRGTKIGYGVTGKKGKPISERLGKEGLADAGMSLIEGKSNAEAETETRRSRRKWKGTF